MGKGEKTGLGRALVKQHNHMLQQNKEKGRFYKTHNNKVLTSITEVSDIDAVLEQADEADRNFTADNPVPNILLDESSCCKNPLRPPYKSICVFIDAVLNQADEDYCIFSADNPVPNILLDHDSSSSTSALTPEDRRKLQKKEEALHAGSLRVPRRPPWNTGMTVDELDVNETQSFLSWRRGLAKLEENEKLVLTPFEKNLDIWRQLWRVVERSDLLVMVVDARDPLFYRCPDLEVYVKEVDEHKRTMLLINKADLLPHAIRLKWAKYFDDNDILFLFWSAKAATAALEGKNLPSLDNEDTLQESEDIDTKVYGRDELLARLQFEAEEITRLRKSESNVGNAGTTSASVTVGFVGYPNVGKSSTINALVGLKRAGVTSTPGKTKHFQTLIISDKLTLCDCPGLVFPSFTSSRHEMIACGVLPIDRMTNQRDAVQVVADKVPRSVIEQVYKIGLPKPKPYEPQSRPPLASELLRAYCASRGYTSSSGLPDETRAARQILKDYIDGKLTHYELPPGMSDDNTIGSNEAVLSSNLSDIDEYDSSDIEDSLSGNEIEIGSDLIDDVMKDLDSFDLANGLAAEKANPKKKPLKAPHKLHRKPQRKKDRSWRTGNDGGDGTPLPRVYQKPVNTGPLKT